MDHFDVVSKGFNFLFVKKCIAFLVGLHGYLYFIRTIFL